jgi:polysaccharide export outer membrane protein
MTNRHATQLLTAAIVTLAISAGTIASESQTGQRTGGSSGTTPAKPGTGAPVSPALPPDYTIGLGDVLNVFVFGEKDLSGDFAIRPDGKFSVPQLGEFRAVGLTPVQLAGALGEAAKRFYEVVPNITVTVREIHSRKVSISGNVNKAGEYPLLEPMTIAALINKAGGLTEYANKKNILVIHADKRPDGSAWTDVVNYNDILNRKNLAKNLIDMRPGDVVIVR